MFVIELRFALRAFGCLIAFFFLPLLELLYYWLPFVVPFESGSGLSAFRLAVDAFTLLCAVLAAESLSRPKKPRLPVALAAVWLRKPSLMRLVELLSLKVLELFNC